MNKNHRNPNRIAVVRAALTGAFALVGARAVQVAVAPDPRLVKLSERQYSSEVELAAKRGTIYDRNGHVLAQSVDVDSIYAEPRKLADDDKARIAPLLARALGEPEREIRERLDSDKGFVWIKRRVAPDVAKKVAALELDGVGSVVESKRYYPNVELAGQVLGFAGIDSEGLEGLENQYDDVLKSDAKRFERPRDARGRLYAGDDVFVGDEETGQELILTVDQQIQFLAEQALHEGVESAKAVAGFVIVEDPRTGEILAMAAEPDYNPNAYWKSRPDEWRDRPVTDVFEPGSTIKTVLMAASIEAGVVKPDDLFFCENGSMQVADRTVRDAEPHGWLSATRVLQVSSNIGAIKIGQRLGTDAYYDALRNFGFGAKTGVDLPGEAAGIIGTRRHWTTTNLAWASFGQGVSVTGIQIANAVSAIANGGVMMKPYVVRRIGAADGTSAKDVDPVEVRRVVSRATADTVTNYRFTGKFKRSV